MSYFGLEDVKSLPVSSAKIVSQGQPKDFQVFLKMMTDQIKNQNPLNPINTSDFALQLATFSGVEQQAHTNKILLEMKSMQDQQDLFQATSLIGREVGSGTATRFDGSPLELEFHINPGLGIDNLALVVTDAAGSIVSKQQVSTHLDKTVWDGLDNDGEVASDGLYSFQMQGYVGDKNVFNSTASVYSEVVGVSKEGFINYLHLRNGEIVSLLDISDVR